MTGRFAEGGNYNIDVEGGIAECRVWSRPDLDSTTGAQLAMEKIALFRQLASGIARGMLFDLSVAPAVIGPKTQEALGEMFKAWEDVGSPIAVVAGVNSVQQLQLRRLVSTYAPEHGKLFQSNDAGLLWLEGVLEAKK
jgi:hypothetical protein